MNFFIIPGNPPAVHFYEQWKQEIALCAPLAKTHVSTYLTPPYQRDSELAMQQVTDEHIRQLTTFRKTASGPLTIIGHSLGGYFASRMINQDINLADRVILVHPFLRAPTERGKKILRKMRWLQHRELIQSLILRSRKILEMFSNDLPHVTNSELYTCFNLAGHEHLTISQDQSPLNIREDLRSKIAMFHTTNDTWCSPDVIDALKKQVDVYECQQPHDFITSAQHRANLFKQIQAL